MEPSDDRVKARTVRLRESLWMEVARRAGRKRISISVWVEQAIEEKIEREDRSQARKSA